VLRRWRGGGRLFPVLILSARGDWIEKVEGIEAGADDYLAKPFEMGELVARIRGLVRRAAGRGASLIAFGALRLDTARMAASVEGRAVRLAPLEYRLLNYLAHHPGRPVSAGEIADHLYGLCEQSDVNAVEALVARLRRKLGAAVIETRRGFGYLLAGAP
jgi:DNA-binding response OmpR family regulator